MSSFISKMNKQYDLTCPYCKKVMNSNLSALMAVGYAKTSKAVCAYCEKEFNTQYDPISDTLTPVSYINTVTKQPEIENGSRYEVQLERLNEIIMSPFKKSSKGLFYAYDYQKKKYIAVDNLNGSKLFKYEFDKLEIAIKWLEGNLEIGEVNEND